MSDAKAPSDKGGDNGAAPASGGRASEREKPKEKGPHGATHDERTERSSARTRGGERARASDAVVQSTTAKPRSAFPEPGLDAVDALDCESIALGITSDLRPLAGLAGYVDWRLCGRLSALLRAGTLTGAPDEQVLMPTLGLIPARRIFLFGWGPSATVLSRAPLRFARIVDVLLKAGVERVAVSLPEPARPLLGLVEEHLRHPLGGRLGVVFGPDPALPQNREAAAPLEQSGSTA